MSYSLFAYLKETQRLIRDSKQELIDPFDLVNYINTARREIALRAQCVRVLTLISGAIIGASVTAPGSGYTNPTVTITQPDFPSGTQPFPNGAQATAQATVIGGTIAGVNITYGGSGYFEPIATISDPTGTGATVALQVQNINLLNQGQEVYPFSSVDLSQFPGVEEVYMVKSVSLIYANYRYSIPMYSFSTYQAYIRQYPFQYQYIPTIGSQFGQGSNGSFYLYPLPSTQYQMEWDCFCLPSDLLTDQDYEALPDPWTQSVKWYAAFLAFSELQNLNSAHAMLDLYERHMNWHSTGARPGRSSNIYGRFVVPLVASNPYGRF